MASAKTRPKTIVFFHPDLGIGGAERLIVDTAVGLQNLGHRVTIFTSHCDRQHCFEEARDGTLDVRVRGNSLFPPTLFHRFHILLAVLRQIHLVLSIAVASHELAALTADVFVVDQLSACVPLLRWLYPARQRTLFYCHFPDQLLADRRATGVVGVAKTLYRVPFDWLEGWSMSGSDRVLVNSQFTKSVAAQLWPALAESLGVIYPCVHEEQGPRAEDEDTIQESRPWGGRFKLFLSVNRFERKKNIGLAIRAYYSLTTAERQGTRLILAGGYDQRVAENVQYHQELVEMADQLGLAHATAKTVPTALAIPDTIQVLFLLSIPGPFKTMLMRHARLLVYTPSNEHFGIVPVEAMQHGLPVLASNTGGPLETIVDGETGWLREASHVDQWTAIMRDVLVGAGAEQGERMGRQARARVAAHFTRPTMARKFDEEISAMVDGKRSAFLERKDIVLALWLVLAVLAALLAAVIKARNPLGDQRASEFARARRTGVDSSPEPSLFPRPSG